LEKAIAPLLSLEMKDFAPTLDEGADSAGARDPGATLHVLHRPGRPPGTLTAGSALSDFSDNLSVMTAISERVGAMTVEEAAVASRVSPSTVRRWIRDGQLPALRVGGMWRILRADLRAFIVEGTMAAEDRAGAA
jgi:excisionase family DNA binding protein